MEISYARLRGWRIASSSTAEELFLALYSLSPEQMNMGAKCARFTANMMEHYGTGLGVTGWHHNGEPEALDNFLEAALVEEPTVEAMAKLGVRLQ